MINDCTILLCVTRKMKNILIRLKFLEALVGKLPTAVNEAPIHVTRFRETVLNRTLEVKR